MLTIYNRFSQIKHVGPVTLNIGANEVPEEDWEQVKTHPIVKGWIKDGNVEVEKGDLDDITKIVPVDKAVEVIESTFDKEQLLEWKEQAERKTTADAIDDQLEYLEKEPEGDEK